ncbi:hypothetical protein Sbal195_0598 [Shewanella baltica OS195]|uniref:Uncharacterized protein n=1 Tax=Shewanella baltica (strain OS195) TaxID=399599 RepID=A9KZL7_SHEB9|nr:hypothetical protein Shew185_0573 [Shewanella baltica OS185]ABX47776.1 hypothetical protein Sbal195_0598 [Shewanella baltica OS195]
MEDDILEIGSRSVDELYEIIFEIDCFVGYFPKSTTGDLYLKKVAALYLNDYWDILNSLSDCDIKYALNKYKNFQRYNKLIESTLASSLI